MDVQIRFASSHLPEVNREHIEVILANALERFRPTLTRIVVFLEDANGPRGGVDKQCRCVFHLRRMPPIVIRDEDENWLNLITRVANRAAFVLGNKVDRRVKIRTRHQPRQAGLVSPEETME